MTTTVDKLHERLQGYATANSLVEQYYEGEIQVPSLGIAIPPMMRRIETVVGWPATVVDVLEERLDFLGWDDDGKYDLETAFNNNNVAHESSMAHVDSLMHGVGFVLVSTGFDDVPSLITAESAKSSTGIWNRRTRRLDLGYTVYKDPLTGEDLAAAVFYEDRTEYYERKNSNAPWKLAKTDPHKLGRCQLVMLPNKTRAGRTGGKSEITRAIRSYTNTAVRTLLGMEINREFFSAPQRYVLGAKQDAFVDDAGNPIPGWKAIMGALWQLQRDEVAVQDGSSREGLPEVGQFPANPPGPFLEQVKGISQLVSAEGAVPPNYLGFSTDNPPSADAINALEARLVKRAERRQAERDPAWTEVGILTAMTTGKGKPKPNDLRNMWRDPSTPTRSADADRAVKLTGAGIMPPDSTLTWEMVGLSPRQMKRLEKDRRKAEFMAVVNGGMGNGNGAGGTQPSGNQQSSKPVDSGKPEQ